jgi:SAM-dependent methyltransferase
MGDRYLERQRVTDDPVTIADGAPLRERERAGYDRVAPAYSASSRDLSRGARAEFLRRATLAPGQQVLDVCTGPGWLAIDAAAAVGPQGRVAGVDLSSGMLAQAGTNAREAGVTSVEFYLMDAEDLSFPAASFDRVLCSLGLMHIPNPRRAAASMARVARPGARLTTSVWAAGDESFLGLIAASLRSAAGDRLPVDYAYATRLGPPGVLEDVLAGAGWSDIRIERLASPRLTPDGLTFWDRFTTVGGLFSTLLAELPPEVVAAARKDFARRAERYRDGDTIRLPATQVLATAVHQM